MTTVLKLGGSVITDKASPETVDGLALDRAAAAIAGAAAVSAPRPDLVLVHGGGSFGHHHASELGVSTTEGTRDAAGVREIHDAMCRLNDAVLDALQGEGVPALPVRPLSAARRDDDGLRMGTDALTTMLAEGFVPVTHGDVVVGGGAGATVVSGDELVVALADGLEADRVGLCSAVPGVLDGDGAVLDRIESFEEVADAVEGSADTDVTGGMAGKIRRLLALDAPAQVFDLDGLAEFLAGEQPGTTVD